MIRLAFQLVWVVCFAGLAACAGHHRAPPGDRGERAEVVRVVSNGWHTAITVPRERVIATGLLPEAADFPESAFLEFGWGDRTYYQAPEATLGKTLRAGLVATPAVMHVDGYPPASRATRGGGSRRSRGAFVRRATSIPRRARFISSTPATPGPLASCARAAWRSRPPGSSRPTT